MNTTQDTLLDRTTSAMAESMHTSGTRADWIRRMARDTIEHLAGELEAVAEDVDAPLSLQDAVHHLRTEAQS